MNKTKKVLALFAGVSMTAAVLTGCGTGNAAAPFDANTVACDQVAAELNSADAALAAATTEVENSTGTPDEKTATTEAVEAQAKVDALLARQKACGQQPASQPVVANCPNSWPMTVTTPSNGRWVFEGVPAIAQASNPAQARAATNEWLDKVKDKSGTLTGASAYLLNKGVEATTLVKDGCATATAVTLTQEVGVALALSQITPGEAPANATNSGTVNGAVVASSRSGINGNRKAVKIVTKDGTTVWIMARCGNAVKVGPPPVPPKPKCPPGQVVSTYDDFTCVEPKDGSKIPNPPAPPTYVEPNPIGTASPPTRPAPNDPSPSNGYPVHDVNPPSEPENPDSGSGAGKATSKPPVLDSPPAPGPTSTATGIVESD